MTNPGRRRSPSRGDRRERAILDTALRLLARKPLAEITIDELAAGAEISRSSFYFYFDSKPAVVVALLRGLAGELGRDTEDWLTGSGPDAPALRRSLTALATLWREHGPLLTQAVTPGNPSGEIAQWRADLYDLHVHRLAARIHRDREAGLAPDGPDPEVLAGMIDRLRDATFVAAATGSPLTEPEAERLVEDLLTVELRMMYGEIPTATSNVAP